MLPRGLVPDFIHWFPRNPVGTRTSLTTHSPPPATPPRRHNSVHWNNANAPADQRSHISSRSTLVPTVPRGLVPDLWVNPYRTSRYSRRHSHAGAWERDNGRKPTTSHLFKPPPPAPGRNPTSPHSHNHAGWKRGGTCRPAYPGWRGCGRSTRDRPAPPGHRDR